MSRNVLFGEEALCYAAFYELPKKLLAKLTERVGDRTLKFTSTKDWERQLQRWQIEDPEQRRILTEAALWGSDSAKLTAATSLGPNTGRDLEVLSAS